MGSKSARLLAEALTEKVGHRVWRVTQRNVGRRIPFVLRHGTDKITQLRSFQNANVSIPDFTTDRAVANGWLREGHSVVCRTLLRSSEGAGIVVAEREDQLVAAPLYTKYFKKKKEFRVHVLNGEVIDVQEKRKKNGVERADTRIRNTANGFVFCRNDVVEPLGLRELGVAAVQALGYHMGGVDIAFNEHHNRLAVLEVNACPGIEGTTVDKYATKIAEWYREQRR